MCRLTAYIGHPTLVADLVIRPTRSALPSPSCGGATNSQSAKQRGREKQQAHASELCPLGRTHQLCLRFAHHLMFILRCGQEFMCAFALRAILARLCLQHSCTGLAHAHPD